MCQDNYDSYEHIKNNSKQNEGILGDNWNRIMKEIWSIIPLGLLVASYSYVCTAVI